MTRSTPPTPVLLDMVGDADLQLHDVEPGNATLKSRVVELASSLGLVAESIGCDGHTGSNVLQYNTTINIVDDHIHAHNLGIPAIDLMDTSYGEPKQYTLGSYWHTLEDTPDKVSATSLNHVGRLVELGLRTNAFVGINPNEGAETNETATDTSSEGDEGSDNDEAREAPDLPSWPSWDWLRFWAFFSRLNGKENPDEGTRSLNKEVLSAHAAGRTGGVA